MSVVELTVAAQAPHDGSKRPVRAHRGREGDGAREVAARIHDRVLPVKVRSEGYEPPDVVVPREGARHDDSPLENVHEVELVLGLLAQRKVGAS